MTTQTLTPAEAAKALKKLARGRYIYLRQPKDTWPFVETIEVTRKAAADLLAETTAPEVEITVRGEKLIIG